MSTLTSLPDELLIKVLSYVIEVPDSICKNASYVDTYTQLFPASAIHVNQKLRQIAATAISNSCTWVELNCDKTDIKQEQFWRITKQLYELPTLFSPMLPTNRQAIKMRLHVNDNSKRSIVKHVFPYNLEALLNVISTIINPDTVYQTFAVNYTGLSTSRNSIVRKGLDPIIDSLQWQYEIDKKGSTFTGSLVSRDANRDCQTV